MIIGADKEFEGTRYIEYKFKQDYPGFKLYDDLDTVVNETIKIIKK